MWARVLNVVLGIVAGLLLAAAAVIGWKTFGMAATVLYVIVVTTGAVLIAGFAGWLLWRRYPRSGFAFLLAAGILTHLGLISLAASLKPLWVSRELEQALVATHLDPRQGLVPGPVAVLGYAEPSFVFAMGTKTDLLNEDASGAVAALIQGRPLYVESRYEQPFHEAARAAGVTPHVVTVVKGRNYSNGRDVVLTLYDNPAE